MPDTMSLVPTGAHRGKHAQWTRYREQGHAIYDGKKRGSIEVH
jgi:hypothetical protein